MVTTMLTETDKINLKAILTALNTNSADELSWSALADWGADHDIEELRHPDRENAIRHAVKIVPPTDKELESMSGWNIAWWLGCHYNGDCDPINHGGYFYDARDWEAWGYANIILFTTLTERGQPDKLLVSFGTVNKPDDMSSAFEYAGVDELDQNNIHAQIDACKSYHGWEPDDHMQNRTYTLDNWKEWRIWRSLRLFISQLRS